MLKFNHFFHLLFITFIHICLGLILVLLTPFTVIFWFLLIGTLIGQCYICPNNLIDSLPFILNRSNFVLITIHSFLILSLIVLSLIQLNNLISTTLVLLFLNCPTFWITKHCWFYRCRIFSLTLSKSCDNIEFQKHVSILAILLWSYKLYLPQSHCLHNW